MIIREEREEATEIERDPSDRQSADEVLCLCLVTNERVVCGSPSFQQQLV